MAKTDLTAARLRELLIYNPDTGLFCARADRIGKGRQLKAGDLVGGPHCRGYWDIRVDGIRYLAHRLAWLYMTGAWPTHNIDHRDRDKRNNRWLNLRDVTQSVNMHNRSAAGITYHRRDKKWIAQIVANGKAHQFRFDTKEEAQAARASAKLRLHTSA